jgi:hypothetical protein
VATYFVEVPGSLNLAKLGKAIEGEEALGTQFLASKLWMNGADVLSNLAEFRELEAQPNPPLKKPKLTNTLSPGDQPEWTGQMVVEGTAEHVVYLLRVN